jgi:hypothetical protein
MFVTGQYALATGRSVSVACLLPAAVAAAALVIWRPSLGVVPLFGVAAALASLLSVGLSLRLPAR